MGYQIEKDWITNAGLRAVVIMLDLGHRCGYVGVPSGHPLYMVDYSEETAALSVPSEDTAIGGRGANSLVCMAMSGLKATPEQVFDVHGSLTYSGSNPTYPVESALHWFGFDCAHCDDAPYPEHIANLEEEYPDKPFMWRYSHGVHRSLQFVESECESLAEQIVAKTKVTS